VPEVETGVEPVADATSCAGSSTTWDRGIGTEGQLVDGGLYYEALTPHRPYHCSTQARDKTVWLMPNPTTATHSPDRPLCGGEPSMPQAYVVEAF
jgi:hypothetical protein